MLDALSIEVDPHEVKAASEVKIRSMAVVYWSGRYLTEVCDRCRRTHPALKGIPDEALLQHEIGNPTVKFCQLSQPGDVHLLSGLKLEWQEE